jgi:tripartite-type tricarboxylate transporter receptor subunit TctC
MMGGERCLSGFLVIIGLITNFQTSAQPADAFYKNQTLKLIVGTTPGATYDSYARILARYMPKYMANTPPIIVQNMVGAGGLVPTNWLYNVAPKDGTTFGTFARGFPIQPLLDPKGIQYDSLKFNWIGSTASETSLIWTWHDTPFKSFEDTTVKEMIVPATGPGADSIIFPYAMNSILGTKFKVVAGYAGGPELMLSVERGETQGVASTSYSNFTGTHHLWLEQKKIRFLAQLGIRKHSDLQDVPLALDFAKDESSRQVLALLFSRNLLAFPFAAPPAVPPDRVAYLRDAFRKVASDPDYLADLKQAKLESDPVYGEEMSKLIADLFASSPDILEKARQAVASAPN